MNFKGLAGAFYWVIFSVMLVHGMSQAAFQYNTITTDIYPDAKYYGKFLMKTSPTNQHIALTNPPGFKVHLVNAQSLSMQSIDLAGSKPVDLVFSPNGQTLYVTSETDKEIVVVNTSSGNVVERISTAGTPGPIAMWGSQKLVVGIKPDGGFYYEMKIIDRGNADSVTSIVYTNFTARWNSTALISPHEASNSFFFGERDASPASLYRFEFDGDHTLTKVSEDSHGSLGGNMGQFVISPDGTKAYMACGGAPGYKILEIDLTVNPYTVDGKYDIEAYPASVQVDFANGIVYGGNASPLDPALRSFSLVSGTMINEGPTTGIRAADQGALARANDKLFIMIESSSGHHGLYYVNVPADPVIPIPPTSSNWVVY